MREQDKKGEDDKWDEKNKTIYIYRILILFLVFCVALPPSTLSSACL